MILFICEFFYQNGHIVQLKLHYKLYAL